MLTIEESVIEEKNILILLNTSDCYVKRDVIRIWLTKNNR